MYEEACKGMYCIGCIDSPCTFDEGLCGWYSKGGVVYVCMKTRWCYATMLCYMMRLGQTRGDEMWRRYGGGKGLGMGVDRTQDDSG